MKLRISFVFGTVTAALLLTTALIAQDPAQAPETPAQTTLDGVFSAAQVTRGDSTFSNLCTGCHTADSFKGGTFLAWRDASLAELFSYLNDAMPEDAPGSLTGEQYADVMAFLLKTNGMPAGKDDLKPDATMLGKIMIKFPDR